MHCPRALFFDVGDTLVFDDPPIAERFAHAARACGFAVDSARLPQAWRAAERAGLQAYLAGHDTDDLDVQRGSATAALSALGHDAPTDAKWRELGAAFARQPFVRRVPPEAMALLERLRGQGVRMGIISDWEPTLPDVLEELELARFFQTVAVSSLVGCRKPDPRLFGYALAQMDVPPQDALHVGDWLELDVRGAQAAGMGAVLFDHARRAPDAGCARAETFAALAALFAG